MSFDLTFVRTGIQLNLYAHQAAITVPYPASGPGVVVEIVRTLYRLAALIEEHTEFCGYDEQVDPPIAEAASRPESAAAVFDTVAASFAERGISGPGLR